MSASFKKKLEKEDMPHNFPLASVETVKRIENNHEVIGILYFREDHLKMCTVPESMVHGLSNKIPQYNAAVIRAVSEINKCKIHLEESLIMKIISNLLKDYQDEWLVETTAEINEINPIIDRIMEDDSVEGVVMTNKDGAPILTNLGLVTASNFAIALHRLGIMSQYFVKELDPFEEVIICRLHTKKIEMMLAPHREFNIIVIQHARRSKSKKKN